MSSSTRALPRPAHAAAALSAALVTAGLVAHAGDPPATPPEPPAVQPGLLADAFDGPLDLERWEPVRLFDTRADRIEVEEGRLVLGLDTIGTDDKTVKLRGLRSKAAFEVRAPLRVSATIDWNGQVNGCYLTAGLALLPEGEEADPRAAPESLVFEWVGVPPGKNVRPALWRRRAGGLRPLYLEGWPQPRREDRVGRPARRTRTTLEVDPERVRLLEDGVEKYSGEGGLGGEVRLLVFVTGHSNYTPRHVYVDDVRVER